MKIIIVFLLTSLMLTAKAQKDSGYKISNVFHIASSGGWDYIALHQGKLYVSHGTQVNILDAHTGDSIGFIPNTNGVHGIAFNDALNRGYTSNGRSNNVTVFDLKTNELITQVTTGENPDAILFEPFSKTIVTCNGRGKNLSFIDAATHTVVATIDVGGKPETAVANGSGKLFVNVEDKNEIVAIDIKTHKILNHWPLKGGNSPTGLAYDPKTNRLFAGCEKMLVVMNAENGMVVKQLTIGDGCDGVAFYPKNKLVFTSNGDGSISVIKEQSADSFSLVGNYPTKRGARTLTIDPNTGTIFLPAADFEDTIQANGRPKLVPGTFQILVVNKVGK